MLKLYHTERVNRYFSARPSSVYESKNYAIFGAMDNFTDDYKKLTGEEALTVKYMFNRADDFQVGEHYSEDN